MRWISEQSVVYRVVQKQPAALIESLRHLVGT